MGFTITHSLDSNKFDVQRGSSTNPIRGSVWNSSANSRSTKNNKPNGERSNRKNKRKLNDDQAENRRI